MPMNQLIADKIADFEAQGLPDLFERDLSLGEIKPPARGNLVTVVVGTRRCGKTYRLYQQMKELLDRGIGFDRMLYFNFEDERLKPYDASLLGDVVDTFYALHPVARKEGAYFFFDEIQEVPEWGTFLRRMVDTAKVTMVATGSSSKMLSTELGSEFRGRAISRELFPLSFSEFVRYKTGMRLRADDAFSESDKAVLRNALPEYLTRGGYIASLEQAPADAVFLLQEYAQRTVAMDVIERYALRNPRVASLFLSRCLASSGRELSVSKVYGEFKSRQVSVSRETLTNLLGYYQDAYLLFCVEEFSRSIADNRRSATKVYAVDPGLFGAFSPAAAIDSGQRLETAVFDALRRSVSPLRAGTISRLLIKEGSRSHEVDFVLGDALLMQTSELIQVTVGLENEKTRERELSALDAAMERYGRSESTMVTMDEEGTVERGGRTVKVVPAWKWLLR